MMIQHPCWQLYQLGSPYLCLWSQLNIRYPQVQLFVLPYLDTVHRFAPQTNPLMDAVAAKPTLKLAPTWKYHKERPHEENQTGNNLWTLLANSIVHVTKFLLRKRKDKTKKYLDLTCKRFVHIAISPQVTSAPKVLQSLRKGRFPTVVKGARYSFSRKSIIFFSRKWGVVIRSTLQELWLFEETFTPLIKLTTSDSA